MNIKVKVDLELVFGFKEALDRFITANRVLIQKIEVYRIEIELLLINKECTRYLILVNVFTYKDKIKRISKLSFYKTLNIIYYRSTKYLIMCAIKLLK